MFVSPTASRCRVVQFASSGIPPCMSLLEQCFLFVAIARLVRTHRRASFGKALSKHTKALTQSLPLPPHLSMI
jgi:hypothetical protein